MLGHLEQGRLRLESIHRFPNQPVNTSGSMHWNMDALVEGMRQGIDLAGALGLPISSISTDSWGVDYVLLDGAGKILTPVFHYRDPRSEKGVERVLAAIDWKVIFSETGIQFMGLNTLFQLGAEDRGRLESASHLLGVGDAFNYLLSGRVASEVSMASTTQLYNPVTRTWSARLLGAMGIPQSLMPEIVPSGTVLGPLLDGFRSHASLHRTEVIASCSHDTGAAVFAVPAEHGRWAYLSSGTWSLMGVESPKPILSDECRDLNFTNEIGFGGTVRLLKNIVGLWIVQECRRHWASRGCEHTYASLTTEAAQAAPFKALINPSDPRFLSPGEMPQKIADFCRETNQPTPETPGEVTRCVLESLAIFYAHTLSQLETLVGSRFERLHIVGGGSKNVLLNQFTANALQIPVIAGPEEATAVGNVLIQAIALGHLDGVEEARRVVRESTPLTVFEPRDSGAWLAARDRMTEWLSR